MFQTMGKPVESLYDTVYVVNLVCDNIKKWQWMSAV
jgi:hypothetical protein